MIYDYSVFLSYALADAAPATQIYVEREQILVTLDLYR